MQTLVLNASDEPLCITGLRRAVVLALGDKADIVATNGGVLRSPSVTIPIPSVIRLRHYVRVPYRRMAGNPTLAGLIARDGDGCAYCSRREANTIDHVGQHGGRVREVQRPQVEQDGVRSGHDAASEANDAAVSPVAVAREQVEG
jgi:5-methylcytosine-specific restriction endonuclease McrA